MKERNYRRAIPVLAIIAAGSLLAACSTRQPVVKRAGLYRPGQQVFSELGCFTCHAVPDPAMRPPLQKLPAALPLNAQVHKKSKEYISRAVLSPDHLNGVAGRTASIGSYREVITLQELDDVITYIRSLPRSPGKKALPPEK